MRIPGALCQELIGHARREAPVECCGLVACQGEDAVAVYPITNAAGSQYRYALDGVEQFRAQAEIEAQGWRVGALYHSHTHAPAIPSRTDLDLAAHPALVSLIIGVADPARPELRAYRIRDGVASVEPLDGGAIVAT